MILVAIAGLTLAIGVACLLYVVYTHEQRLDKIEGQVRRMGLGPRE